MLREDTIAQVLADYGKQIEATVDSYCEPKAALYRATCEGLIEHAMSKAKTRLTELAAKVSPEGGWEQALKFYAVDGIATELLLRDLVELYNVVTNAPGAELATLIGQEHIRRTRHILDQYGYNSNGAGVQALVAQAKEEAGKQFLRLLDSLLESVVVLQFFGPDGERLKPPAPPPALPAPAQSRRK